MSLTITHTHADGTMIDGTSRGDGTAEILRANGWRWGRSIGMWFVAQTRLVSFPARAQRVVAATVTALEQAGFAVTVEADWTVPDDSLDARIAQQKERIAALEAKLSRKTAAEAAASDRDRAASDALPYGGEPIKIGHHSEGRHRSAIDKAYRTAHAAMEARQEVAHVEGQLDAARHHLAALEAQVGRVQLTRDDVLGSAEVRDRDGWHKVLRVNQKTVSVEVILPWMDRPMTRKLEFARVLEARTVAA